MPDDKTLDAGSVARSVLEVAVDAHDQATGDVVLWMGEEPTFTDRSSEASEWLSEALGGDKEARARRMIARLREESPGGVVLRPVGRQYAGEPLPRFCYGLYARRNGEPLWSGPPDRLVDGTPGVPKPDALARLRDALCDALRAEGWFAQPCAAPDVVPQRLICRPDAAVVCCDAAQDPRLARDSIHAARVEGAGLTDALAAEGSHLVLIHQGQGGREHNAFWVEVPAFAGTSEFAAFLRALAAACVARAVPSLGLRGFAPPIDDTVAWTTVTPDPAVIEVNLAPQPTLGDFHRAERRIFELAAEEGLSPYRLQYTGEVSDSGGGGQLTFGGPSPGRSPFFTVPTLLPRLIRYLIRHPSLSYWFATPYLGASSQAPRVDEGVRDRFLELRVALEQLERIDNPPPQTLWATLRHFLADESGNPHRSELNVEKLDNPFLPGRGRLGLVELRALSMAPSPDHAVARALLFRSIVAMLMRQDRAPQLSDWGDALHDRFALPFYLRRDLAEVLADLADLGLGVGGALEALLLERPHMRLHAAELAGCRLRVEQGLEFWPLVGDVASQEQGGSRLVDASTSRLQLLLEADGDAVAGLAAIEVTVNGVRVPMRSEATAEGAARVFGVRYRSFVPLRGLHPTLPAESCITLTVAHPSGAALRTVLHPWRPSGAPYAGLPRDLREAAARRAERALTEEVDAAGLPVAQEAGRHALTAHCLDLRRVAPGPPHRGG